MRLATVKSEIHNVLSTVRLTERSTNHSTRFASEVLLRDETPVIRRLKMLHDYLLSFDSLEEVDAPTFLEPFLEVIRTPTSNGVVTGVALSSLNKLLLYGSLSAESPRGAEAVNSTVEAVCNCRFEATHHYGDEVVLLQILEALLSLLRCPVGEKLTEENAWNLVKVCYHMSVDPALSELLRASAANHLSHVVLTVFSRASELIEKKHESNRDTVEDEKLRPYSAHLLTRILAFLSKLTDPAAVIESQDTAASSSSSASPSNEALHAMGLQLINIALETASEVLGSHDDCVQIIQNDLCKFLLSNSQTDDLPVLALTLRVVYNLFSAMKGHLKVQLEVFLTSVHFRIVESATASNEKKELALESLLDFCHDPLLVLDLHTNYDCDVNCSNLFEGLSRLLSKHAIPRDEPAQSPVLGSLTALNVLALDGTFSIASHIAARCFEDENGSEVQGPGEVQTTDAENSEHLEDKPLRDEELMLRKTFKRRLLLVASQFNKAPTKPYWKEYAKEIGVLKDDSNNAVHANGSCSEVEHQQVAKFLLTTPGLDKCAIGEYLSEASSKDDLRSYVGNFEMAGLRIDIALRRVLECFRIPGEAQKIERVMEIFSQTYFDKNPDDVFSSADATFIFAFSIVMLHTDRHSRNIPDHKRMTLEQFVRNVRGINDGKDFDASFLEQVYQNVAENEFILSFDQNQLSSHNSVAREWDVIMRHSSKVEFARFSQSGSLKRAGAQERDMFDTIFEPTLQAVNEALERTLDGRIVIKSLKCCSDLARIACFFNCQDEFNQVLITLCRHFFLVSQNLDSLDSLREHQEALENLSKCEHYLILEEEQEPHEKQATHEKQEKLGYHLHAMEQSAADPQSPVRSLLIGKSILHLVGSFGHAAREGWANVIRVIAFLSSQSFLPQLDRNDVIVSYDQKLLSEEQVLVESRKSRLLPALFSSPRHIQQIVSSTKGDDASAKSRSTYSRMSTSTDSSRLVNGESHDEDGMVGVDDLNATSHSVWSTVANFIFGDTSSGVEVEQSNEESESHTIQKIIKSVQDYFRSSSVYTDLIRESSRLPDESLAHLLTALSSPFSLDQPSWCSEFTSDMKVNCLELIMLLTLANRGRFQVIATFVDSPISFCIGNSAALDAKRKALECYFTLINNIKFTEATPTSFSTLPLSLQSLELAKWGEHEAKLSEPMTQGLEETMRAISAEDVENWKVFFRLVTSFIDSTQKLSVVETLINENLYTRTNILLLIDLLTALVNETKSKQAIYLFKKFHKLVQDDSVWFLILSTLRMWWDEAAIELEVQEVLQFLLFDDPVSQRDKVVQVFDRLLFPLVTDSSKRRRGDAESILAKYFLTVCSVHPHVAEELIIKLIEALTMDFKDPQAMDDCKESAMQRVLNILRVVVVGHEKQEELLGLVSKDLDIILPNGWKEDLLGPVSPEPETNESSPQQD